MRDAAWARSETVIDEWDEEFDRGKVGAGYVPSLVGWGEAEDCPLTPRAFLPLPR